MDLRFIQDVRNYQTPKRRPDSIFVETRDADMDPLNSALDLLARQHPFCLITVGPVDRLKSDWERTTVREADEVAQAVGMLQSRVMLSVKPNATSDYLFVRAMLAGCRPVVPDRGAYTEMVPESLAEICLCKQQPDAIARALAAALEDVHWEAHPPEWRKAFAGFDAIPASRQVDTRLEQLRETRVGTPRD
jgi:hypothetical protein